MYVPGVNDPGWLISAYSWLPIIRTFKGNRIKVGVIGSSSDRGFELLGVNCIKKKMYLTIIPRALMGSESSRMGYWLRGHEGENKNNLAS